MPTRKTVETPYRAVDEKTLEKLRSRFDTRRLLDVVHSIDVIRHRIDGLRQDLLDLHSMAAVVIDEGDGWSRVGREEPIWELAEMISSDVSEFTERLEHVYEIAEELESFWTGETQPANPPGIPKRPGRHGQVVRKLERRPVRAGQYHAH
jgi:hypothetical protein